MSDKLWECKDCETGFPTAEAFVYHVPTCVPREHSDLILQNAGIWLRSFVKLHNTAVMEIKYRETKSFTKINRLAKNVEEWLKTNHMQAME